MSASLNLICPLVFGFYRQAVTHKKVVLCFFAMSSSLMDDLNPWWLVRFNHDQAYETAYIHIIPGCIQGTLFNFLAAAVSVRTYHRISLEDKFPCLELGPT